MRGFRAALYKDLKLFLNGAGVASLILSFLLLLGLGLGSGDISVSVKPFPVAVRDEDNTVMSRSLISQMGRVELFSEVRRIPKDVPDSEALADGAAAAVTIPKNLFYDLYHMENEVITVTLNSSMQLESTLFKSVFCSVMDIIRANQAAGKGLYAFCYGSPDSAEQNEMYSESAESLVMDALGRQSVFDAEAEQVDIAQTVERRVVACVLSVAAMFFALSAVKGVPEERKLGVLPRFIAAGGSTAAFVGAKLAMVFLLTLPLSLLSAYIFGPVMFPISVCLIFGSFGIMFAFSVLAENAASALRWGNLFILLSLGYSLWPGTGVASWFTLTYYVRLGIEASCAGMGIASVLGFIWPVPAAGLAGLAFGVPRLRYARAVGVRVLSDKPEPDTPKAGTQGAAMRLKGLVFVKFRAMTGGWRGLAMLLIVTLAGGFAARGAKVNDTLKLTVCDLDASVLSAELVERLNLQEGVEVTLTDSPDVGGALLLGKTEGLLTIGKGYADSLATNGEPCLHYESSPSASSAQGAREIIAGQAAYQRSRERAYVLAEEKLGHSLTADEAQRLSDSLVKAEKDLSELYRITTEKGAEPVSPFLPDSMGFVALGVLLTLLTAAPWSGEEGKKVERRMLAMPRGLLLSYGSDCYALSLTGLIVSFAALLPDGNVAALPAAVVYSFCAAALALALTRFTASAGRVDALAPFTALFLCLLGGCFIDFAQFSPVLERLALATPPGLALSAAKGEGMSLLLLAVEGAAFAFLGAPGHTGIPLGRKHKRTRSQN